MDEASISKIPAISVTSLNNTTERDNSLNEGLSAVAQFENIHLRKEGLLEQSAVLRAARHQIQVLHGLTGGPFHEIVNLQDRKKLAVSDNL